MKNNSSCALDFVWFWFGFVWDCFYTCHCTLTLFHDSALLPATKVHSHSHFVYYFIIMNYFWTMIVLVSMDLLVNCHVCFTLFSRDPFLRGLEGCYGLYRTFPISNLIPGPKLRFFFADSFSKNKIRSPSRGFVLTCFPLWK